MTADEVHAAGHHRLLRALRAWVQQADELDEALHGLPALARSLTDVPAVRDVVVVLPEPGGGGRAASTATADVQASGEEIVLSVGEGGPVAALHVTWSSPAVGSAALTSSRAAVERVAELVRTRLQALVEEAQHHALLDQLEEAIVSRPAIEQAKGAVGHVLGISPDEAFALLRHAARTSRTPLQVVCRAVLDRSLCPEVLAEIGAAVADG